MNLNAIRMHAAYFHVPRKILLVMKITTFILLISVMAVSASSLAQKITLNEKKVSLEQVLKKIRLQSGYDFIYSDEMLSKTAPVSVSVTGASLDDALKASLKDQPLSFEIEDGAVVLRNKSDNLPVGIKREIVWMDITGKVVDDKRQTLPGVTVRVKGTTIGTTTDVDGKFKLTAPDGSNTLLVSFVGFVSQEVSIAGRAGITIVLVEDISKLTEVLVVGYGSQSREKLSTSITKLDNRVLTDVPYTNIGTALEGNIAGLQVQTLSGQPGAAPRIILRGGTSLNRPLESSPLYIMDGIVRPNALADINANDIESIQVLKDAAATAIYGARGSNGVILLTTKRGKANKTAINYNFNGSAGNPQRLVQYASAADYIALQRQGYVWAGFYTGSTSNLTAAVGAGTGNNLTKATGFTTQYLTPANQYKLNEGWSSMVDPVDATKTLIYKETVFQDLIYRTAYTGDHYVSASGGSDRATFYTGLGYTKSQGTAEVTNWNRLSLNFNGSYKIKDNLNAYAQILYSNRTQNQVPNLANVFYRSASLPGTAKYMFEDGTIAPGGQNNSIGNPDYFYKGPFAPQGDNGLEDVAMTAGFKWNILKDLVFEPYVSMLREGSYNYTFQPAAFLNGVNGVLITSRTATQADNVTRQEMGDATLTYMHTFFEKHSFEAKVGYSHYFRNSRTFNATGQNAATDLIPTLNGSATPTLVNGQNNTLRLDGAFFRVNYDYDSKYLLTFNGRYDGASNLGQAHRFGFFPGVSAGWNIDKENFWNSIDALSKTQFKLRTSYGINGNISFLGDYQPEGSFITTDLYGGQAPIRASVIPNSNLQWEQSKTFDIGADIGLFDRKISLIVDYFNRRTDNLLTTVNLPQSTGFSTITTNFGSLQTRGFEVELNIDMLSKLSKFKWTLAANAGYTKRTILKLPDNGIDKNRQGGTLAYDPDQGKMVYLGGLQEGGTIGIMTGAKYMGIYQTDAEAAIIKDATNNNRKKFAGDAIWGDLDGNGIIEATDQVIAGNQFPSWTGGINNYFTYKHFSLNIRTDFTTGASLLNYPAYVANGQLQGDALPTADLAANVWKKVGDVNAKYPRYMYQSQTANYRTSTMSIEKADFLCLRTVSLGYTLPQLWAQKAKLQGARLTVSGNNLHYFTNYSGSSPEGGGIDLGADAGGRYPISRTYTLSLNVTF
jgi:TonB-linked SusC/RagA family outer membrane protein